jgi:phosphoglycolate phosphatase-like HAD superfamily hydrolase
MGMPDHLVFVRHGESEGNVVQNKSKHGDESGFTDEFFQLPGRKWELTKLGISQAQSAGKWIRENADMDFLLIGDTENDWKAARENKIHSVGVKCETKKLKWQNKHKPEFWVSRPSELLSVIKLCSD